MAVFNELLHGILSSTICTGMFHFLRSSFTTSLQLFGGLPLPAFPETFKLLILLIHPELRIVCPNHLKRRRRSEEDNEGTPTMLYIFSRLIFSSTRKLRIHLSIDLSFLSRRSRSSFFNAQHSLACRRALRTYVTNTLPLY
jgi:hypothetical protein